MRPRPLFAVVLLLSVTATLPSCFQRGFAYRLPDNGSCQVALVPVQWRFPKGAPYGFGGPMAGSDTFVFRRLRSGAAALAIQNGKEADLHVTWYSQNRFSFDLLNATLLKPISQEELDQGVPLACTTIDVLALAGSRYVPRNNMLYYKARRFMPSGDHIDAAYVSPNGRSISIKSFDAKIPSGPAFLPLNGKLHFDIFDVYSGRKLFVLSGKYNGFTAEDVDMCWLTASTLLIDFSDDKQTFILCHPKE
jgi:hypothetical protein